MRPPCYAAGAVAGDDGSFELLEELTRTLRDVLRMTERVDALVDRVDAQAEGGILEETERLSLMIDAAGRRHVRAIDTLTEELRAVLAEVKP